MLFSKFYIRCPKVKVKQLAKVILEINDIVSFNQFPNKFAKTAQLPLSAIDLSNKSILLTWVKGSWTWMSRTEKNSCFGKDRQVSGMLRS